MTLAKPSEKRMKPGKGSSNDNKEAAKSEDEVSLVNSNNISTFRTKNKIWHYVTITRTDRKFNEIKLAFEQGLKSTSNKIIQVSSDVLVPIFFLVLISISTVNFYFSFDLLSVFKFILVLVLI